MSLFNLSNYKFLITRALSAGYCFIGFDQIKDLADITSVGTHSSNREDAGKILLRHDIDADLIAAVEIARAEAQLGIKSTFFLMWRSPCYNLMSRAGQNCAEEIIRLGHHIGLHYDQGFDASREQDEQSTSQQIYEQADWMETLLNCQVAAVSFHQPSKLLLQAGINCGNRINTYDQIRLSDFRYVSDSNRVFPLWSSEAESRSVSSAPHSVLANCYPQNLQLLIHPMWWIYDDATTELVWDRVLLSNFEQMQEQLYKTERAYGNRRTLSLSKNIKFFKSDHKK